MIYQLSKVSASSRSPISTKKGQNYEALTGLMDVHIFRLSRLSIIPHIQPGPHKSGGLSGLHLVRVSVSYYAVTLNNYNSNKILQYYFSFISFIGFLVKSS